jgi:hypothetical protein
MTAITKHEPRGQVEPIVSENAAVMAIIERAALNPDVDAAKMDQLFALQEKVLSRNARTEYFRALAMMAGAMPAIAENGRGHNQTKYAKWEDIQAAITPVLGQYGFALSFRTKVEDKAIRVTAILAHREGHTEENELLLPADNSGSKNAVQAVGSSITYGFRYTACALLNIQTGITDDDGRAAGGAPEVEFISDEQLADLRAVMKKTNTDENKFAAYLKEPTLGALTTEKFKQAMAALKAKAEAMGVK